MSNSSLADLTTAQLRRAIAIKERIDALNSELSALLGAPEPKVARRGRRKASSRQAASKVAAAGKPVERKRRKFSAAARARMRQAAKARWAAAKAKGQNKL